MLQHPIDVPVQRVSFLGRGCLQRAGVQEQIHDHSGDKSASSDLLDRTEDDGLRYAWRLSTDPSRCLAMLIAASLSLNQTRAADGRKTLMLRTGAEKV